MKVLNFMSHKFRRVSQQVSEGFLLTGQSRYSNEFYTLYDELDAVKVIQIRRLGWLGRLFRMQEMDSCRKLTVLKPKLRCTESVEEDRKNMGVRRRRGRGRMIRGGGERGRKRRWTCKNSSRDSEFRDPASTLAGLFKLFFSRVPLSRQKTCTRTTRHCKY
jgi:hypothetical protein